MRISDFKIWIDPGHGGTDVGAISSDTPTIYERDIVLKVANYLKTQLQAWGCTQIQMTRTDNSSPKVDTTAIPGKVNNWGADIFVSIHCNALDTTARGTETYTPTDYTFYENDLATKIQNRLVTTFGSTDRKVKRKNYNVLSGNNAWACLAELLFIDNPSDASILRNEQKLESAGKAIAMAMNDFVIEHFRNIEP